MRLVRVVTLGFAIMVLVVLSIKLLVNPPPPGIGLDSLPRLGVDADYNFSPTTVEGAGRSGAGVIRAHISWAAIEPANTDPSHYIWGYYDPVFTRIANNNLRAIGVIDKCPAWACPFMRGPINSANMGDYTEFINTVVARYSRPPYNVRIWELFDEPDSAAGPNGQWSYGNHASDYVAAMRILHDAAKSMDPESVVMNGGLAYDRPTIFRPEFVTETLQAGLAQYVDALNFHYFRINGPGWTTVGQKAAELRAVMSNTGVTLPLVCTSVGESSANITPWFSSDAQQARYVVKVNAQAAAAGIKSTVWYLTQDFDCQPTSGCPAGWETWARHGLLRSDGSDKPSLAAMRTFAQEVGSGVYLRQLGSEMGVTGGLEGYSFGGGENRPQVSVIWSNGGTATLTLPNSVVAGLIRAVSINGQEIATQRVSEGVRLSVGADPVYLEWRSSRFVDVPTGSAFFTYVDALAQNGIVSGFVDGTFRPNDSTLRGQLSKMMVLAQGWAIDTSNGPHFLDVPADASLYPYIETAYNHHVISGYGDNTFRPYMPVTRGQLSKIIMNARGWTPVIPAVPTFSDVPATNPFFTYIETMYSKGVISGYGDGTFRWSSQATRGQAAKIVYNAINAAP